MIAKRILMILVICGGIVFFSNTYVQSIPPRMSIFNFDVNVGDATLIVSPDGRGVLIDGGNRGRGLNPIKEFLDNAKSIGFLASLDYVVVTHYDADHIGGLAELFESGWYPTIQVYDRGDTLLPPFDKNYIQSKFPNIDADLAETIVNWGTAPSRYCDRRAAGTIVQYMIAAEAGGKRKMIIPGDEIQLDHGIVLTALLVNATDLDGNSVDVDFQGRRDDCASNDLSVALLVEYGDFEYLIAGDLTGEPLQKVADVEELIKDDVFDIDVYHVNHHGSETSSSLDFMNSITPTVAIISNGQKFGHPRGEVVENRILAANSNTKIYVTNKPKNDNESWQAPDDFTADLNYIGYDGIVELAVWKRTYRVFRWRDGNRIIPGDRYFIK